MKSLTQFLRETLGLLLFADVFEQKLHDAFEIFFVQLPFFVQSTPDQIGEDIGENIEQGFSMLTLRKFTEERGG